MARRNRLNQIDFRLPIFFRKGRGACRSAQDGADDPPDRTPHRRQHVGIRWKFRSVPIPLFSG
jgi:hypothetical protein